MAIQSSPVSPVSARSVPPGLLPSLDPAAPSLQNPATGVVPGRFASVESHFLTDCLSLTVWCPDGYHARLEAVVRPFGDRIAAQMVEAEGLPDLDVSDNAPRLIVVPGLADVMSGALADQRVDAETGAAPEGLPPDLQEMVARWRQQAEAVLEAVREARGHVTLLAAEALLGPLGPVRQALAARYNLPLDPQADDDDFGGPVAEGQSPAVALMAGAVAAQNAQVMALLDRLEVAVLKVDGIDLRVPQASDRMQALLLAADTMHRAEREAQARTHAQDLHRIEAQAEANIQRLRHLADEARLKLLQREAETRRLSEDAQQSTAATEYLKEELTRRETTYSAQSSEVAMLRHEAEQLEIARKSVSLKGNRLDREVEALARNIALRDDRIQGLAQAVVGYEDEALALRAEVEALRRSTSWRLTAPVRGVSIVLRKILGRG